VLQHIASNPLVNVGGLMFEPDTWEPQLVSFDYLKPEQKVLDPSIEPDWKRLDSFIPGSVPFIRDISRDKQSWIVVYGGAF